jgi:alpha-1,3-rhamnosyltransferase
MSVSVVVPSYNHAPFVEKTLRSIFKQTLAPKKLIVIDDGSKDESAEIIERVLQRECPFDFSFIKRANCGLSATLNEGFSKSDGDYFAYLGSDDVWLPRFLEKRIELLQKRPSAVLAFGHAFLIDEFDRIIDCTNTWTPPFADGDMLPLLLRGNVFSSPSVVYRRAALEKHFWNEDSILEDYELYLKLSADGEFALDAEEVLCGWRQHGWNVSRDVSAMLDEWLAAQNRTADKLKISGAELERIQSELKFKAALDFIRHGEKRVAIRLIRKNLSGAKSPAQIAKILFRLSVPRRLFQWNRQRKKQRTMEKLGKLNI